jgi:gamma-glutamyltranspeptidase/glutathione hydrolase
MKGVVVCPEPLAAFAGAHVLQLGGSAIDAAIATAFAQTVVSPAMTTIAGGGIMNVFHAPTGRHRIVDFMGYAGERATADMYVHAPAGAQLRGYASLVVPTMMRGLATVFDRFGSGRISWAALIEPAIRFAEEGFCVYPYMHQYWRAENPVQQTAARFDGHEMLATTEACAAIFTRGARVHAIGERIVQPDLARTLRILADEGADAFYTGIIGKRLARDLEAHDAPVTARDLAECRCDVGQPLQGVYRGLTVTTDPAPHIGILLVELLHILDGYDLAALGAGSAAYYELMARALARVFRDRARFMADPAAQDLPATMTDRAYAAELRARIDEERAVTPLPGTTQVSTLDGDGSAVSLTHSIGTGSGVVTPGLGFMLNNNMMAFDPRPGRGNSIAPGKRAISGGGPTLVLENGQVRYVLGSPHGGRKISAMAHVLAELVDFGHSPAAAVTSPRVHCEGDLSDVRIEPFFPIPDDVRAALTARGLGFREDLYGGRVCLIAVDPATGRAAGASDPRGDGGLAEV